MNRTVSMIVRPWITLLAGVLAALPAACPAASGQATGAVPDDPAGRALLAAARQAIAAYHEGHAGAPTPLRVVYFHPQDREPLPDYAARLDRVLNDVSDFYRDGLRRLGVASDGLPLERKEGRLVLHLVRGRLPASGYSHESGGEVAAEIREALRSAFDVEREHVLVLYALCRREPDGRYVFDAPYYGAAWSNQRHGLCHAADCELLDPRLLGDTARRMVFTEHYYPRREETVAAFNSMYLGGVAHELGHGLGLKHDAGSAAEQPFGVSLMGSGNLHYRRERWGGGPPVYLSRVSALQLAAHPMFTGSNRGRSDAVGARFAALEWEPGPGQLRIRGRVAADIPPYAVVAYVWPGATSDHSARTYPVAVTDGGFDVLLPELRPDGYFLRLSTLHVNGGTTGRDYRFGFDAAGRPEIPHEIEWPWIVEQAEAAVMKRSADAGRFVTDAAIAAAPSAADQRRLRVLRAVLQPPAPRELAQVDGDRVHLSDVAWTDARVGWGRPARNHYWFDDRIQQGVFLLLGGQLIEKGLYAHSPSRYAFRLDRKWRTFTATVGLRDGANPQQGSAIFSVKGDGRTLRRTSLLRPGMREDLAVDVAGVRELELIAEGGGGPQPQLVGDLGGAGGAAMTDASEAIWGTGWGRVRREERGAGAAAPRTRRGHCAGRGPDDG